MSTPTKTNRIVWTNGCFDVIHRGHIESLKFAKSLGDRLVVGLDTDEKVRSAKGESRPFNVLEDRMKVLESIRYVDEVIPFDPTAYETAIGEAPMENYKNFFKIMKINFQMDLFKK